MLTTDQVVITATKKHVPVAPVARPAVSAPASAPPAAPALSPADSSPGGSTYYRDCASAHAAGVAPLHRGDLGYHTGLDRDGDGIACERQYAGETGSADGPATTGRSRGGIAVWAVSAGTGVSSVSRDYTRWLSLSRASPRVLPNYPLMDQGRLRRHGIRFREAVRAWHG
jgi:excalibur calcium-binding domain-containing protein